MPFENSIVVVKLSGQSINSMVEYLRKVKLQAANLSSNFLQKSMSLYQDKYVSLVILFILMLKEKYKNKTMFSIVES